MSKTTTLTPNALAEKLAGAENREKVGKTFVRPLLREFFPREASARNTAWYLTEAQVKAITAAYRAKVQGKSPREAMKASLKPKRTRAPKAEA